MPMPRRDEQATRLAWTAWQIAVGAGGIARALTFPSGHVAAGLFVVARLHDTGHPPTERDRRRFLRRLAAARVAVLLGTSARLAGAIGRGLPPRLRAGAAALAALETAGTLVLEWESQREMAGFGGYYQHIWLGSALAGGAVAGQVLTADDVAVERLTISIARAYYGSLYSVSGVSKIRRSGRNALGPTVLRHAELTYGPEGAVLLPAGLLRAVGPAAVVLECAAGPLAMSGRRAAAVSGALLGLLHLGLFARLRISFWHLAAPAVATLSGEVVAEHLRRLRPGARRGRAGRRR